MADVMPDYRFERMRFERQRKQIQVTMLDCRVQLADFEAEQVRLAEQLERARENVPTATTEGTAAEVLRSQLAVEKAELAIMDIELRLQEIAGQRERLQTNITASDVAIADIDDRLNGIIDPDKE